MNTSIGDHAVVLGASMAGLLTAGVLARSYGRVTVFDRDAMPEISVHRRGVPQDRHLHFLHPRGRQALDELFPGLTARLIGQGAPTGDVLGNIRWQLSGHQFRQANIRLPGLLASRPFLEGHVRARVSDLPNVTLVERTDVVAVTATPDRCRVSGVRVHGTAGGGERAVPADLVIDATGRGSRAPLWLSELGYEPAAVDRVDIGLGYATRIYRLRPGALGTDMAMLTAGTPQNPRGGAIAAIEGGRHILTLFGILGDHPPTDPAGFDAFAASLLFPDITDAIRDAEPLTDPVSIRFPASVRHRYERLRRFPIGLLVLGDAVCSFNPIYGQGMTAAAIQAGALQRLLARGEMPQPRRYFRTIARTINTPWDIAVGADLAFPQVPGTRTAKIRMVNRYLPKLHAAATADVTLGRAFVRVLGMVDRPEGLLRPDRMLRVLWTHRPGAPAPT
ncbi:MAG TPA: FAD-binding monooxygenase [Pseudonocardiaceae bacterium]|jgi:2-polyprenyl-6-methoxyphenol hydroxylase-like FAD-dependent oxidoreductase|nr:FAD-binding monooxygenase [Pseudonocardiaceae bacterium]